MSRVSMMNVIRQMLYCYYIELMNMRCKKKVYRCRSFGFGSYSYDKGHGICLNSAVV
jgi:hypothetical protein